MNPALAELEEQAFRRPAGEPRNARFTVAWHFDGTRTATVTVNRRAGTFEVRPHRRRRRYTLPLALVAQFVAERIAKAEALEKRKARRTRRR